MKERLKSAWQVFNRPSVHYSLGFLTMGGFIAGVIFWGAFNTVLEATNTELFCTSCHEMRDNVFEELRGTIHYTNRSGVRATCPDCHVPHEWTDKIARKMQASKEVWGKLFGTINTREKFLAHRRTLAEHEWGAATATTSTSWISPDRKIEPPRLTRSICPAARKPASTATRESPTSFRTWRASKVSDGVDRPPPASSMSGGDAKSPDR
jgi:cytochrome c-type protein NapC